jgi:hypothetical protein
MNKTMMSILHTLLVMLGAIELYGCEYTQTIIAKPDTV